MECQGCDHYACILTVFQCAVCAMANNVFTACLLVFGKAFPKNDNRCAMVIKVSSRFLIDGNYLRVGQWEFILVRRIAAAIGSTKWFDARKKWQITYLFIGPRVLTISRLPPRRA